jgi:hypothetical protein
VDASLQALRTLVSFFFHKLNDPVALFGFIDWTRLDRGLQRKGLGHLNMGAEWVFKDAQRRQTWNGRGELIDTLVGAHDMLVIAEQNNNREMTDLADCREEDEFDRAEKKADTQGLLLMQLRRVQLSPDGLGGEHTVASLEDKTTLAECTHHTVTEMDTAHPRCSCDRFRWCGRATCSHIRATAYAIKQVLGTLPQDQEPFTGESLLQRTADAVIERSNRVQTALGSKDFLASAVTDRRGPAQPCQDSRVPQRQVEQPTYKVVWPAGTGADGVAFQEHTTWEPMEHVPWNIVKLKYPTDRHFFFKTACNDRSGRTGADSTGLIGRPKQKAKRPSRTDRNGKAGKRKRSQKKNELASLD